MSLEDILDDCKELMKRSRVFTLTTINPEGLPTTRAVLNPRNEEIFPEFVELFKDEENPFLTYISTNTSSEKFTHMKTDPRINAYFFDDQEFMGLMLGGDAEIIEDMHVKRKIWVDWWVKYYPQGVEDPDYTLVRLNPKTLRYYHRLTTLNLNL